MVKINQSDMTEMSSDKKKKIKIHNLLLLNI